MAITTILVSDAEVSIHHQDAKVIIQRGTGTVRHWRFEKACATFFDSRNPLDLTIRNLLDEVGTTQAGHPCAGEGACTKKGCCNYVSAAD